MVQCKKGLSKRKRNERIFYACIVALPLLQFCIFYIYVNFNSVLLAFRTYENDGYVFAGWDNLKSLFRMFGNDPVLKKAFANTFLGFIVCFCIGIPSGFVFANYIYKKCPGGKLFKVILFLPTIIPAVVMARVFGQITDSVLPAIAKSIAPQTQFKGIVNEPSTAFGAMLFYSVWVGFGANMLLYVGAMSAIPESVVEAAQLDGITPLKEMWHITLPYVWPTLATFITVSVAGIFNNQFNVYTFYGRQADSSTYSVGLHIYFMDTIKATVFRHNKGLFLKFIA